PFTSRLLPIDLEPALGFMRQQQEIRTVRTVNAHTTAACHIPDHGIARHRLTALRVAHHQSVDALNANALGRARDAVDEALEDVRLGRLPRFELGIEMLERERDVDVALADRR